MELEGLSRADAERLRKSGDRAREAYVRHFYGCDAARPALYHLVIDSTALAAGDRRRGHRARPPLRAEQRPDHAARERVEGEVEADERGRDVLVDVELLDVERVHGEDVPVRRVALRRRRAAPRLLAVVVAHVERALGQLAAAAGAARELGRATPGG